MNLKLSGALSRNLMTEPILAGRVAPGGMDVAWTALHPSEMFWRQLRFRDFDISEMSVSSLLIAIDHGDTDWVALPVFTTREFFHTRVLVRTGAGIDAPEQLIGKRVGVPEYQQTAALWARGALEHEFGVSPRQIKWFMERTPSRSHGGATGFRPPEGVDLSYIPPSTNIGQMLVEGELDATLLYLPERNLVDRSEVRFDDRSVVRPLFADQRAEGVRYYRSTGILPLNHCVVVRRELAEDQPWVVLNVYDLFQSAKAAVQSELSAMLEPYRRVGVVPAELDRSLAEDPLPYGIAAQRVVIETAVQYSYEQGLISKPIPLDAVFSPATADL